MAYKEQYLNQLDINSRHVNQYVAEFGNALLKFPQVHDIVENIFERRPDLTPLHFGLLIQSAFQYLWLKNKEKWNSGEISWAKMLPEVLDQYQGEIIKICVERNVAVTIPQRYLVLKAIANLLDKEDLVIFDVGSGFIPKGIGIILNQQQKYHPVPADDDSEKLINSLLERQPMAGKIICTDVQVPDPIWTASCFWVSPQEIKKIAEELQSDNQLLRDPFEFRFFDITSVDQKPISDLKGNVDLVMMSNLLYQLTIEQKEKAFKNIAYLLKSGGWMLSLEYFPGGSRRRPFTFGALIYPKSGNDGLGEPIEIFKLDSADCQQIKLGKDFFQIDKTKLLSHYYGERIHAS